LQPDDYRRFGEALLAHLDAAYNLARWLTRDDHAAEDVVQEAYYRALKYAKGFRGGDGRPWLLRVVRRAAYDWLAKRRHAPPMTVFDEDIHGQTDPSFGPDQSSLRQADQQQLHRALANLSPEFREVMVLRELEGLSYQQIASVIDKPIGTVMSRLARGRKLLRERLVGHLTQEP
jgi:RNA polymerase sigma-70 factor (ECF subfamily)